MASPSQRALSDRVAEHSSSLSSTEGRVASFFVTEADRLGFFSAVEVGTMLEVSDATVIRTAQALGFEGFSDLKRTVRANVEGATDLRSRLLASVAASRDGGGLHEVLEEHLQSIAALEALAATDDFDRAVQLFGAADRIVLAGTGPSAAIASYGDVLFSRLGISTLLLTHTGPAAADELIRLRSGDALLALAYGRVHPHLKVVFRRCDELGVPVVVCTDTASRIGSGAATAVLRSGRGMPDRYASHAATVLLLEALAVSLAAAAPSRASQTLDQLNALRAQLRPG